MGTFATILVCIVIAAMAPIIVVVTGVGYILGLLVGAPIAGVFLTWIGWLILCARTS